MKKRDDRKLLKKERSSKHYGRAVDGQGKVVPSRDWEAERVLTPAEQRRERDRVIAYDI